MITNSIGKTASIPKTSAKFGHRFRSFHVDDDFKQSSFDYDSIRSAFSELALGFVHICQTNKLIKIRDYAIVYFQYTKNIQTICMKSFQSLIPGRRLAWRFLAINLYNDPYFDVKIFIYII